MARLFFKALSIALLAAIALTASGCGMKPNASMSAAIFLGIGAAAYGAYTYYTSESKTQTAIVVINNTGKPIQLWINGELWGTVALGATVTIAVMPGSFTLGAGENTPDTTTTQVIEEGTSFTWTLVPAQ